ncbi:MAG: GspE/PulE family protein [Candidatus Pacebacteria bacterium]|nr:GspE/PulE family protein [Candidatus Paceibacterota bacterium]
MNITKELVKKGIIDKSEAAFIENESKSSERTEEDVILEKEIVSEDFLFQLKSEILRIPLKTISSENIELKTLEIIPEESARYYKMISLSRENNYLDVGMVYPEDLKAREALEFLARQSKVNYNVFLILPSEFEKILRKYRTLKQEVGKALEELEEDVRKKITETEEKGKQIEGIVEEAPISKVVAVVLRHAVDGKASDVHIEPGKERVRVRFRLDGILYPSLFLPLKIHAAIISRIKILCSLKIDETRIPQDGRFSAKISGNDVDFRVSTLPTSFGEKAVIRILDSSQRKIDFESLGLTGRNLELIKKMLIKPFGMILSTGPTGSGKTTTLYVALGLLNKEEKNVVTLEDPVEYFMEGVNQSQVKPEIGYNFVNGLRHILRQDPDVIMVGEIRDKETASLAVHAALTGHIVLSTLHTSNSFGVIPRLIDMGVKQFLIPPTLKIAIAQRLVRKLCPYCKKKTKLNSKLEEIVKKDLESLPAVVKEENKISSEIVVYEAVGCARCRKIGYSGRIGLYEILEITDEIKEIVLKNPSETAIKKESYRQGMVTMRQDGFIKAIEGVTTIEEVLRTTEES